MLGMITANSLKSHDDPELTASFSQNTLTENPQMQKSLGPDHLDSDFIGYRAHVERQVSTLPLSEKRLTLISGHITLQLSEDISDDRHVLLPIEEPPEEVSESMPRRSMKSPLLESFHENVWEDLQLASRPSQFGYKRVLARKRLSTSSALRTSPAPSLPPPEFGHFSAPETLKPFHLSRKSLRKSPQDKVTTSPISWHSRNNGDMLPSIPTNTLWPFSRNSASPMGSRLPSRGSSPILEENENEKRKGLPLSSPIEPIALSLDGKPDLKDFNSQKLSRSSSKSSEISEESKDKSSSSKAHSEKTEVTRKSFADHTHPPNTSPKPDPSTLKHNGLAIDIPSSPFSNITKGRNDSFFFTENAYQFPKKLNFYEVPPRSPRREKLSSNNDNTLALYSKQDSELNIMNNRGEKRKSLLKSELLPKKRSPLKSFGSFKHAKRLTVIFDDDFDFHLEKELLMLGNEAEGKRKNFSISSFKQVINHIKPTSEDEPGDTKDPPKGPLENEPENAEHWYWTFAGQAEDSLIRDVIVNTSDYDYKSTINTGLSGTKRSRSETIPTTVENGSREISSSFSLYTLGKTAASKRNLIISNHDSDDITRNLRSIFPDDSLGVSDKSVVVPSGYAGEYDKEKWSTLQRRSTVGV